MQKVFRTDHSTPCAGQRRVQAREALQLSLEADVALSARSPHITGVLHLQPGLARARLIIARQLFRDDTRQTHGAGVVGTSPRGRHPRSRRSAAPGPDFFSARYVVLSGSRTLSAFT